MGQRAPRPFNVPAVAARAAESGGAIADVISPARLRSARRLRGPAMSQATVATAVGCNPSMIGHLESGRRKGCTLTLARAIAYSYGYPVERLFAVHSPTATDLAAASN